LGTVDCGTLAVGGLSATGALAAGVSLADGDAGAVWGEVPALFDAPEPPPPHPVSARSRMNAANFARTAPADPAVSVKGLLISNPVNADRRAKSRPE
jgi:hypothetical protein